MKVANDISEKSCIYLLPCLPTHVSLLALLTPHFVPIVDWHFTHVPRKGTGTARVQHSTVNRGTTKQKRGQDVTTIKKISKGTKQGKAKQDKVLCNI